MTTENILKNYILERYNSIREFTQKIDMSYSTMDSILKRGIRTASLANILKICDELRISADELANGRIVTSALSTNEEQPEDVNKILDDTRRKLLSADGLMFNGKPADEESIQSILDAMEIGIEMVKKKQALKK